MFTAYMSKNAISTCPVSGLGWVVRAGASRAGVTQQVVVTGVLGNYHQDKSEFSQVELAHLWPAVGRKLLCP
jgi:hypothetical protein